MFYHINGYAVFSGSCEDQEDGTMEVKLISVTPKGVRKSFSLNGPTMTLGRQPDCDVQVPLAKISRQHCQLQVNENKIFLRDMKSANGTYVNGEKIIHHELVAGDIIALADVVKFLVQIDGNPAKIDDEALKPGSPAGLPQSREKSGTFAAAAAKPAKAAAKTAAKPAGKPEPKQEEAEEDDAEKLLGDSFFMDMEDEDEDK
jgi:pSer/pThr/pTyr-binding forkhead associated (FHA) protein